MNVQKRRNAYQFEAWVEHRQDKPQALCPQFRPCVLDGLYPVRGHCNLGRSPGWFMIPSIEEYEVYCTSLKFNQCQWFRGSGEMVRSVAGQTA